MQAARVTIVCIFRDEERFLREAIESVLAQDMPDWELVLVDDGSVDGSRRIAEEAVTADERVSLAVHPGEANRGMSASRNLGVAAGRAPLVTFIDGDDRWPRDKLSRQIAIMDAYPDVGMTVGGSRVWRSWQGGKDEIEAAGERLDCVTSVPDAMMKVYPLGKAGGAPVHALVRRELYERLGGFVDEFTGFYEDQVFFAKVYAHSPVWFSSEVWQDYREHSGSCSAAVWRAGIYPQERERFLGWLEGYLGDLDAPWTPRALVLLRKRRRELLGLRFRTALGRYKRKLGG